MTSNTLQLAAIEADDLLMLAILTFVIYRLIVLIKGKITEPKYVVQRNRKPPKKKLESTLSLQEQIKIEFDNHYQNLLGDKEFTNKQTTQLADFIIDDTLNHFDLHKLAQLNGIKLQMNDGWNDLLMDLIKELNDLGWDREVSCIKEKFGELRFYSNTPHQDLIDLYTEKSKYICEVCGNSGELRTDSLWWVTLCDTHYTERKN